MVSPISARRISANTRADADQAIHRNGDGIGDVTDARSEAVHLLTTAADLAQLANRRRRGADADHALAAQRIGEPPGAIRLGGAALWVDRADGGHAG